MSLVTLNCLVRIDYSIEVRNESHAEIVLMTLYLLLSVFEKIYNQLVIAIDFWNDPENKRWPEIQLPKFRWPQPMVVAGKLITIAINSVSFGLGVSL